MSEACFPGLRKVKSQILLPESWPHYPSPISGSDSGTWYSKLHWKSLGLWLLTRWGTSKIFTISTHQPGKEMGRTSWLANPKPCSRPGVLAGLRAMTWVCPCHFISGFHVWTAEAWPNMLPAQRTHNLCALDRSLHISLPVPGSKAEVNLTLLLCMQYIAKPI